MIDWQKWILTIVGALIVTSIITVWRLVSGKPDQKDLDKVIVDFDRDIKAMSTRIDQTIVTIAQTVSKTDLIDKLSVVSVRADDKDVRVQRDLIEVKSDIKTLAEKLAAVDKKLDELPTRVASLEQTRNQAK